MAGCLLRAVQSFLVSIGILSGLACGGFGPKGQMKTAILADLERRYERAFDMEALQLKAWDKHWAFTVVSEHGERFSGRASWRRGTLQMSESWGCDIARGLIAEAAGDIEHPAFGTVEATYWCPEVERYPTLETLRTGEVTVQLKLRGVVFDDEPDLGTTRTALRALKDQLDGLAQARVNLYIHPSSARDAATDHWPTDVSQLFAVQRGRVRGLVPAGGDWPVEETEKRKDGLLVIDRAAGDAVEGENALTEALQGVLADAPGVAAWSIRVMPVRAISGYQSYRSAPICEPAGHYPAAFGYLYVRADGVDHARLLEGVTTAVAGLEPKLVAVHMVTGTRKRVYRTGQDCEVPAAIGP